VLPLRDSAGLSPASPIVHLASGQEVHPLWLIYLSVILVDYLKGVNQLEQKKGYFLDSLFSLKYSLFNK
jgi:hypothetical protein